MEQRLLAATYPIWDNSGESLFRLNHFDDSVLRFRRTMEREMFWRILTDWVATGIADEHFLKVWTANRQHDFVRLQEPSIAGERHVH